MKKILDDIGQSVQYSLHTHTQFCDGRATMHDMVSEAVHMSFTHLGFTPHSPIPIASTCNMSEADVALYLQEVDCLQELFPQIKLYKGMEIDYLGDEWGATNKYFSQLPLDYTISSVHFIRNQQGEWLDIDGRPESFATKLVDKFDNDLRYVVDTFFDASCAMVEAGGFDIIGHFDKIKRNASYVDPTIEATDWYQQRANQLIDLIIERRPVVEINTKTFSDTGHLFPAQRHWRRLLDAGIDIVINSDAHYPALLNASRPQVIKALRYLKEHSSKQKIALPSGQ